MRKLTSTEEKVASLIQRDIPLTSKPFEQIANICSLTEKKVLDIIEELTQKGYIRRFGAILRHQKVGYTINALVLWSIPPTQKEKAGRTMAGFPFVSHCYEREPAFQGKYNIFTMLHTKDRNIAKLVKEMAQAIKSHDFLILESIQEYKKISPEYFL